MKKIINEIKFWARYIFDVDFRLQVKYEEWSAYHTCVNCGAQDWAGNTLTMDPGGSGMLCQSCLRAMDDEEELECFEEDDYEPLEMQGDDMDDGKL